MIQRTARIPSNRMPKFVPGKPGTLAWVLLGVLGICLALVVWWVPMILAVIAVIVVVSSIVGLVDERRRRQLVAKRRGESICTFARSFDCRTTDTWLIRGAYEEVTALAMIPIRADDRLTEDLKLDEDDADDLCEVIAQRAGRSLERCQINPLCGKIETVRDLVEFLACQPSISSG